MSAVVAVGNSSVKMSNKNLTVVTAPDQKEAMENDAFKEEEYVAPEIDGTNVALDGRADAMDLMMFIELQILLTVAD